MMAKRHLIWSLAGEGWIGPQPGTIATTVFGAGRFSRSEAVAICREQSKGLEEPMLLIVNLADIETVMGRGL